MRKWAVGLGISVLGVALLGIACSSGDEAPAKTNAAQATSAGTQIAAADYKFTPTGFSAQSGKAITVTVTNNGKVPHTFVIDEFNVDKTIDPGQSVDVTLTPGQDGDFTYYCRLHHGMKGTVSVTGGPGTVQTTAAASPSASTGSAPGYYGY